jgi:hypothetical protein
MHHIASMLNIEELSEDDYIKMYKELDVNNDGQVDMDEFVTAILQFKSSPERKGKSSVFKNFFSKINKSITTKSEMILDRLKMLKKYAQTNNDAFSMEHLEW